MARRFYDFIEIYRGGSKQSPLNQLANHIAADIYFPKDLKSYEELSHYLEMDTSYVENMDVFDQMWQDYIEREGLYEVG